MTRFPTMTNPLKILSTCCVLGLALLTPIAAQAGDAPEFTLPGENNNPIELAAFRGQVVYVDFWASWCAPCRESFPFMNELHDDYAEGGLKVIAINLDSDHQLAAQFLNDPRAAHSFPKFDIAYDPDGSVAEAYKVRGMPSSYLIDRDGNIVYSHLGFRQKDQAKIESRIADLLETDV